MSRLQDLIAQLCPNGVPYKTLGEVCVAETGQQLNRSSLLEEGEIPVYNGGTKPSGFWHEANMPANTITISQGGASAGFVQYIKVPFWAGAHCYTVSLSSPDLCYKFLYYFLKVNEPALMTSKQGAGIPGLNRRAIYALRIPVPPLAVQEEIARILDCFTALEAELEAELEARKKQYAYWRERLLSFGQSALAPIVPTVSVNWVPLGEIATITRGGSLQKKDLRDAGVPAFHYGQIYTRYGVSARETFSYVTSEVAKRQRMAQPNDLIMAVTSENVEDVCKCVAWIGEEAAAVSGHTAIIHHKQNAKFLSYYFQTSLFFDQKRRLAHGTKVIEVTPEDLKRIRIPLPPLAEQERIVGVLDRFEALCGDLGDGLPREIALRRKQMADWRERLLAFRELDEAEEAQA